MDEIQIGKINSDQSISQDSESRDSCHEFISKAKTISSKLTPIKTQTSYSTPALSLISPTFLSLTHDNISYSSQKPETNVAQKSEYISESANLVFPSTRCPSEVKNVVLSPAELELEYLASCRRRNSPVIEKLSKSIKKSKKLKEPLIEIDLTNIQVSSLQFECLADIFTMNFGLASLNLTNTSISDKELKIVLHALYLSNCVTNLYLGNNKNIKTLGIKYLSVFLIKYALLAVLDLSNIPFNKQAVVFLSNALATGPLKPGNINNRKVYYGSCLKVLKLDYCFNGERSSLRRINTAFSQIIEKVGSKSLGRENTDSWVELLAIGLRKSSIIYVSLRGNRLSCKDWKAIEMMLCDTNNEFSIYGGGLLLGLDISDNELEPLSRESLQVLIGKSSTLEHLDLSYNHLSITTLQNITEVLGSNSCLKSLNVSHNHFLHPITKQPTHWMPLLSNALPSQTTLEYLSLVNTNLDNEGVISLVEACNLAGHLHQIDIRENARIGLAGALALFIAAKKNKHICNIWHDIPHLEYSKELQPTEMKQQIEEYCVGNKKHFYDKKWIGSDCGYKMSVENYIVMCSSEIPMKLRKSIRKTTQIANDEMIAEILSAEEVGMLLDSLLGSFEDSGVKINAEDIELMQGLYYQCKQLKNSIKNYLTNSQYSEEILRKCITIYDHLKQVCEIYESMMSQSQITKSTSY